MNNMANVAIPKIVQIQAVEMPTYGQCEPHIVLYALCEDGSLWAKSRSISNESDWAPVSNKVEEE